MISVINVMDTNISKLGFIISPSEGMYVLQETSKVLQLPLFLHVNTWKRTLTHDIPLQHTVMFHLHKNS
jgi:hypothetical protein